MRKLFKILLVVVCYMGSVHVHLSSAQNSTQDFLNAHNMARAQVGVGNLTWDDRVAAYARNYSYQRKSDCNLVHSGGPYDENISWSSGDLSGTQAVAMWVDEKNDYDYISNSCAPSKVCGHYTQVIWQESLRLGCSKVECRSGGTFISCNYGPPGNFFGERPYAFNQSEAPSPEEVPSPKAAPPNFNSSPPEEVPSPKVAPPNFNSTPLPPFNSLEDRRQINRGLVASLIAGVFAVVVGLVCIWLFLRWKRKKHENHADLT